MGRQALFHTTHFDMHKRKGAGVKSVYLRRYNRVIVVNIIGVFVEKRFLKIFLLLHYGKIANHIKLKSGYKRFTKERLKGAHLMNPSIYRIYWK